MVDEDFGSFTLEQSLSWSLLTHAYRLALAMGVDHDSDRLTISVTFFPVG